MLLWGYDAPIPPGGTFVKMYIETSQLKLCHYNNHSHCPLTTSASTPFYKPKLQVGDNGNAVIVKNTLTIWELNPISNLPGTIKSNWYMFPGDTMCDGNYCVKLYHSNGQTKLEFKA